MIGRLVRGFIRRISALLARAASSLGQLSGSEEGTGDDAYLALSARFPDAPEHWLRYVAERTAHLSHTRSEAVGSPPAAPKAASRTRIADERQPRPKARPSLALQESQTTAVKGAHTIASAAGKTKGTDPASPREQAVPDKRPPERPRVEIQLQPKEPQRLNERAFSHIQTRPAKGSAAADTEPEDRGEVIDRTKDQSVTHDATLLHHRMPEIRGAEQTGLDWRAMLLEKLPRVFTRAGDNVHSPPSRQHRRDGTEPMRKEDNPRARDHNMEAFAHHVPARRKPSTESAFALSSPLERNRSVKAFAQGARPPERIRVSVVESQWPRSPKDAPMESVRSLRSLPMEAGLQPDPWPMLPVPFESIPDAAIEPTDFERLRDEQESGLWSA